MNLRYRFGPFELDVGTLELRRDGVTVPLEPRPAAVLLALVEQPGELVTRRALRERVWPRLPDAADASLNTCIRQIRDALGDDSAQPAFIETLRGRGYRFVHPVEHVTRGEASPGVDASPATPRRPPRLAAAVAVVLVAAVALGGLGRILPRAATDEPVRVAIPAPRVLANVPDGKDIGAAVAAELRAGLAVVAPASIFVLGRETTERLGAGDGFASDAAVPVTHVLEVTIRPLRGELRLVAQLLDAGDGRVVWGDGAYATTATLGAASASLTRAAAAALGAGTGARLAVTEAPLDARAHLLKARYVLEQHADLAVALAHVDTVLARHPALAEAYGLRAEALVFHGRPAQARESVARALELDAREGGALRAAAWLDMLHGDWGPARRRLDEALRETPNDPLTLSALAFLLTVRGRFGDAARTLDRSLAADPLAALLVADAGLMHLWAGRADDAVQACAEAVVLRPDATWAIGCAFDAELLAGRTEAAAAWGRRLLATHDAAALIDGTSTNARVVDAVRRWRIDRREAALAAGDGDSYALALAYADAGRRVEAIAALERAAAAPVPSLGLLTAAVDPRLRTLRRDERYRAVVARLELAS